jgi:hypothetical protein
MMITYMYEVIASIPILTLLGIIWYIYNDKMAEIAEIQNDSPACGDFSCVASRCKKTYIYV